MGYVHIVQVNQTNKINIMLSPRLTNCPECANIPDLLNKINCKLAELGNSLYNNISYMLNKPIAAGDITQLIAYRRILTYKYINPDYAYHYSINRIASKVLILTAGCKVDCNCNSRGTGITSTSTTTSTTTCPPSDVCFSYSTEAIGNTQCTTEKSGFHSGKPYYQLLYDDCTTPFPWGYYVWWNNTLNQWNITTSVGDDSSIKMYNNNPGEYPVSNVTYPWVYVNGQIGEISSTLGECPL
jgi:hypothetical protein